MNQTQFQVESGTICVSWNLFGLITRIEWKSPLDQLLSSEESNDNSANASSGEGALRSARCGSLSAAPTGVQELVNKLKDYFRAGAPLEGVSWSWIDQSRWTPFQCQVYAAISEIPFGETRTYGWVAKRIGKRTATRAVGQALKNNPLPILVPCHRVVASTSLGGFMGSVDPDDPEIRLKVKLLSIEQDYLNPPFSFMDPAAAFGAHCLLMHRTHAQNNVIVPKVPFASLSEIETPANEPSDRRAVR